MLVSCLVLELCNPTIGLRGRWAYFKNFDLGTQGIPWSYRSQPPEFVDTWRTDAGLKEDTALYKQTKAIGNGLEAAGDKPAIRRLGRFDDIQVKRLGVIFQKV